jgi:hypothetical protein
MSFCFYQLGYQQLFVFSFLKLLCCYKFDLCFVKDYYLSNQFIQILYLLLFWNFFRELKEALMSFLLLKLKLSLYVMVWWFCLGSSIQVIVAFAIINLNLY